MCLKINCCTCAVLLGILQLTQGAYLQYYIGPTSANYVNVSFDNSASILTMPSYDSTLGFVIHAHGFGGSPNTKFSPQVADALLATKKWNVCLLNWEKEAAKFGIPLTQPISYTASAVPQMIEVAKELSQSILNMVEAGFSLEDLLLLGHSLGGQLVCETGRDLQKNGNQIPPGRVYTLDPARPLFEVPPLLPEVSTECGAFVCTLHTNPGGYGTQDAKSHVDVYPRTFHYGTQNIQPGCNTTPLTALSVGELCSHNRALELIIEALELDSLQASKADNLKDWVDGKGNYDDVITYKVDMNTSIRGTYFLQTYDAPTYGMYENGTCPSSPFPRSRP